MMLAKTVKPAAAWREANSSKDNRNITMSTAEGIPSTARMPEMVQTSQQQYESISRDANSTIWTPTTHEFSRKFAKKASELQRICRERLKKEEKFPIFGLIDFGNSDSY
jgi:hypothetical protein